jgi:hypothetical protein
MIQPKQNLSQDLETLQASAHQVYERLRQDDYEKWDSSQTEQIEDIDDVLAKLRVRASSYLTNRKAWALVHQQG